MEKATAFKLTRDDDDKEANYQELNTMISQYFSAETDADKEDLGKTIREYAGFLREKWESEGFFEEIIAEEQEDLERKKEEKKGK